MNLFATAATVATEAAPWYLLFFVPFTLLWWVLIAVISIYVIYALERELYYGVGLVFLATFLAMWFLGGVNVLTWIIANPLMALAIFGGYFLIGAVFSVIKWILFVTGRRNEYEDLKVAWLQGIGQEGTTVTENFKADWKKYLLNTDRSDGHWNRQKWWVRAGGTKKKIRIIPVAWEHKARVTAWITVWPWSAFWTIFDDIIIRIGEAIQTCLAKFMDAIAMRAFSGTDDDFEKKK